MVSMWQLLTTCGGRETVPEAEVDDARDGRHDDREARDSFLLDDKFA